VQATKLRLNGDLDLREIAKKTPGYVGADLSALAKEAAASAVTRIFKKLEDEERASADVTMDEGVAPALGGDTRLATGRLADPRPLTEDELEDLAITMEDFSLALTRVQPSAQREGFTTTPNVTWDDVGSLTEIREELKFSIAEPIAHPERFQAMGLNISTGVLLYGPPGCGKTLVAKATANEAMANFISIKGPELLNKYVGESERAVRTLFQRARSASPCVLFFDEMDSLAPRRGSGGDNTSAERVVNQLLTEMDGLEARNATFLIAATNRPDMIDPAMLRPGRLDKLLYVPLPPPDGRVAILKTLTRRTPIAPDVRVDQIALGRSCEGFSGADLAALVREACVAALKSMTLESTPTVTTKHFEEAFTKVQPSVSKSDHARYDELRRKLRRERGTINSARRSSSAENLAVEPASNKRVRPGDRDDRDDRDAPELATS
jgi:ribosome biogenesis ATPase